VRYRRRQHCWGHCRNAAARNAVVGAVPAAATTPKVGAVPPDQDWVGYRAVRLEVKAAHSACAGDGAAGPGFTFRPHLPQVMLNKQTRKIRRKTVITDSYPYPLREQKR